MTAAEFLHSWQPLLGQPGCYLRGHKRVLCSLQLAWQQLAVSAGTVSQSQAALLVAYQSRGSLLAAVAPSAQAATCLAAMRGLSCTLSKPCFMQ